jgi:transcriptional regulator with XRE-family HTH domain
VGLGVRDERYQRVIAKLRAARIEAGVSQAKLADLVGHRQQFVSKYESGERRLDIVEFFDITRALGLNPSGLVDGCL